MLHPNHVLPADGNIVAACVAYVLAHIYCSRITLRDTLCHKYLVDLGGNIAATHQVYFYLHIDWIVILGELLVVTSFFWMLFS